LIAQPSLNAIAVGKWHLGYGMKKYTPCERGFDRFYGSYEVGGHHYDHTVGVGSHAMGALFQLNEGHGQTLDLHQSTSVDGGRTRATHKFVTNQRGVYSSDMWSTEVVRQLSVHSSTTPNIPLFMYVAFTTIHTPLMVDEKYIQQNMHMTGSDEIRINAGMMTAMDEGYGLIVNALEKNKMYENSIILTFSDNGGLVFQGSSNFPLRGQKIGPWEGGIRSVAFITGGHSSIVNHAGTTSNTMMHAVDIHTLALHWAEPNSPINFGTSNNDDEMLQHGANIQTVAASYSRPPYTAKKLDAANGKLMFDAIAKRRATSPRKGFVSLLDDIGSYEILQRKSKNSMLGKCVAIRMGKWKMIEGHPGRDDWYPVDPSKCFHHLIHEGVIMVPPYENKDCIRGDFFYERINNDESKHKYVPKSLWLFNIEKDPSERYDLSSQYPDVIAKLRREISKHRAESVAPFPDRWASLAGMMAGNFHEELPGNGYEAGLANWMEEGHLQSISFYRKARSWLRMQLIELGIRIAGLGQVHRESTSSNTGGSNRDHIFMGEMTKYVKMYLGKCNECKFTEAELLKLATYLQEKEREGRFKRTHRSKM
jgi:arylsulfatase B